MVLEQPGSPSSSQHPRVRPGASVAYRCSSGIRTAMVAGPGADPGTLDLMLGVNEGWITWRYGVPYGGRQGETGTWCALNEFPPPAGMTVLQQA